MGLIIVKADKDIDLYVEWSTVADGPTCARLNRADNRGSSMVDMSKGYWDDAGFIPATIQGQRWLRRSRFGAYCLLTASGDDEGAYLLTEPLDSEVSDAD